MYKKQIRKFCSSWNALVELCQAWQVVESSLGSSKGKCERTAEVVSQGRGWIWGWAQTQWLSQSDGPGAGHRPGLFPEITNLSFKVWVVRQMPQDQYVFQVQDSKQQSDLSTRTATQKEEAGNRELQSWGRSLELTSQNADKQAESSVKKEFEVKVSYGLNCVPPNIC